MTEVQIGVFLPTASFPGEPPTDVVAAARHAEELGFESVWVVDQLILGDGAPLLESVVSLAAVAGATTRVRLGLGVVVVPLRSVVWLAKQVASLQHLSRDRVMLGLGSGGDRHRRSWAAAGVDRRGRGRLLDAAVEALPPLIAGEETQVAGLDEPVRLAPAATVPPIVLGGDSDPALVRTARYADVWMPMGGDSVLLRGTRERLAQLAAQAGRPAPSITMPSMVVLEGDPDLPDEEGLRRRLGAPDGPFGIPAPALEGISLRESSEQVAARLAEYARAGVDRAVFTLPGGSWMRQASLLAEALGVVGRTAA